MAHSNRILLVMLAAPLFLGCVQSASTPERNAFLTLAETFGAPSDSSNNNTSNGGGGSTDSAEVKFRDTMSVEFINTHAAATLNTSFIAWVNVSSIRSADQQDALLRAGYVQLTHETKIGTVFTLAPGTFIFNGAGNAGATTVRLNRANGTQPTTQSFTIVTPDVLLVFVQPPVSCDNVAFFYTDNGDVITDDNGNGRFTFAEGGLKTLAQVDVYQCDPLNPGLFLKVGGGTRKSNEYFEGENVTITFRRTPDANDHFANVAFN